MCSDPPEPSSDCLGFNPVLSALVQEPQGHKIHLTGTLDGVTLFCCMGCGSVSEGVRLGGLGKACKGGPSSAHTRSNLSRIQRGIHPNHKRGDVPLDELVPLEDFTCAVDSGGSVASTGGVGS